MKNAMLATVAVVVGFAGFAQDASAGHGSSRNVGRRIAGAVLQEVLAGSSRRRSYYGPVYVSPIASHHHYHVSYHMDGSRRMHFHSHSAAHRYECYLESLGIHAKLIHGYGYYDVVYHMHGSRSRTFRSHSAAHYFERRLERLGVHAKVIHH